MDDTVLIQTQSLQAPILDMGRKKRKQARFAADHGKEKKTSGAGESRVTLIGREATNSNSSLNLCTPSQFTEGE